MESIRPGPLRDLLDDPQIAVGIVEGAERPVAGALRVEAGLARLDGERRTVPDVTHVDAELEEPVMSLLDVRDDEGALGPAWRGRVQPEAERNRGRRARRSELNEAQSIHRCDVVVEPPTQLLVERLGSVDVGHGDDVVFKLHGDTGASLALMALSFFLVCGFRCIALPMAPFLSGTQLSSSVSQSQGPLTS